MPDDDSILRQRTKDSAYVRACREHGIEPEKPNYRAASVEDALLDKFATEQDGACHNGSTYLVHRIEPEALKELEPEAEAAWKVLELIMPAKCDIPSFVATAGRRCLVMAWMLGRRPEPLAEMARQLGITRASLSTFARRLEDRVGVHGRGQKSSSSKDTYAANARRSWKLRRLNGLIADAAEPTTEAELPIQTPVSTL
jgi:hypothetical protein